ncbi:MAG: heavy-metal-associated domain-containing protein [Bacteroidales bacterium]
MKKVILSTGLLLTFVLTFSFQTNAQCESSENKKISGEKIAEVADKDLKKTSFEVDGKCEMCENRIEQAAKDVKGVKKADWDQESHMLTIHHKKDKVDLDDVHGAIAKAGHDTSEKKAEDETYASLPSCCKYRED